jgi:DNA topoisomerase I
VSERLDEIDARDVNSIPIGADADGTPVVVRVGRYGPYVQRGEQTAGIPDNLPPDELNVERALELVEAPSEDRVLGPDPESGLVVMARAGRYGPYVQLGEASDDGPRPRTASLFKTMELDTITLDDALRLLTLPRAVGVDPDDGEEILAQNGRYGPYLKKGSDTRSLDSEDELFTIDVERAKALFAQPKRRRGSAAAKPGRELGSDPTSGRPVVVKDGRYGPYVTDGETNASIPRDQDPEAVTLDQAAVLLEARRGKGGTGAKRGATKRAGAKKPAKKKTAKKKTKKKAPPTTSEPSSRAG